ncbi:uncharacterized protein [Physcomitrium patens]|uniref:Uncharacterized protein n=1 Tax=Physcomitrium patens TaxID=3218 RepID=A0A2K1L9E5_PHYPA|nr:mitochondrial substrate carrier family protein B-like [Physcomitrium patens]XP_024383355.1 mitochondrial substrate carrier family protein B-like [Physcomitrium patens]XP_024383363.1 mitochondrial substrate carrier family protein B-like [Physcomitrium patens]XP_024383372.1 mitochondrial substrate carrier family protein B-like [Physcomitrium patens]PNR62633.1 hypothetical protein PHYPA_001057 [Physcomitrium patens]|eukprot:XP_024383346.1 mitochondrial substrate carrier family protein B-like [Physcomitrella patens]
MQPHAGDAQIAGVVGGAHRALASAIDDRPNSNNEASSPGAMQEGQVRPVVVRAPSQISTASQLLAGGIAGAFSKTCTAPLARLTILFQVQGMRSASGAVLSSPSILKEASRISREEGFRAFWKGNGVTIVHRLPYSSINFFAYEQYKMHLRRIMGIDGDQESLGVGMGTRLLAGGGAGITAASLTYPLDLVRTRLAAQTKDMYYKGITHALITITKDEGFWGLYKGMGTTLMGVGPNIAINFCVYETLKSMWVAKRSDVSPAIVSLACGSFAGICSSTATFPIDLVRRRMQLEGAGGKAKVYKHGLSGTFKEIITKEGLFGLYRGILPEYYKVIPSVGIVFMTYEFMKRILRPRSWDGL